MTRGCTTKLITAVTYSEQLVNVTQLSARLELTLVELPHVADHDLTNALLYYGTE